MASRISFSWLLFGLIGGTVSGESIATGSANEAAIIGSWHFSTDMDPIDDTRSSTIEVKSDGNDFRLQCDKQGPGSIYPLFGSDRYLGGRGADYDRRALTVRFDSEPAVTEDWIYKGEIAFLHPRLDANRARNVVGRIASSRKLAIRAITYDGQFVDALFELTGSEAAVAKLRESCKDGAVASPG